MTAGAAVDRDRLEDGGYIAVSIAGHDLDEVREWLMENCTGDFLVVLGQSVVFERRDRAASAVVIFC